MKKKKGKYLIHQDTMKLQYKCNRYIQLKNCFQQFLPLKQY